MTDGTWTSTGRNGKYIGWDGSNFFTTYNKVVYYGPTRSLGNSVSISLPTSGYQDMRITYQNGKYWAPYYGASGWALYYSENLSTWASVSMSGGASTSNTVALFYDEDAECYYKIDRYASSSQSAWIYYCQNPLLNDWTQVNLLSSVSVSWPIDFDLALNKNSDGQFCFPWAAATRIYVKYSSLLDGDAKALPNVSLSGTYVYIRVKT